MGLGGRVVTHIRACTMLQPCLHVRVKPAVLGAVEEDTQGVHEVPGKWRTFDVLAWLRRQQREA